jgi:hypothetical protein
VLGDRGPAVVLPPRIVAALMCILMPLPGQDSGPAHRTDRLHHKASAVKASCAASGWSCNEADAANILPQLSCQRCEMHNACSLANVCNMPLLAPFPVCIACKTMHQVQRVQ